MDLISERVSVEHKADSLSVVITARLTRPKEALLVAWFVAWTLCGVYFVYELTQPQEKRETYQGLLLMLAFWTWFELRIGRVVLWRLKGFELWRLKEGRLTVKDSIFGYGRAHDYFVDNIQRFGPIQVDVTSWKWQLNDSFWVIGGERLGFEHAGKKVAIGKGLTKEETERLAQVMERALRVARKKAQ